MKRIVGVFWEAGMRLANDGGLANAGNIALSLLLSLFPFMILVAVMVDFWGEPQLLEQIIALMFEHWPAGSAAPIAEQVKVVLGQARGEILTFGNLVALVLATNGIESARDGLNRAYKFKENRSFFIRRLQGCLFVMLAALAIIVSAVILVGTPVVWRFAVDRFETLSQLGFIVSLFQYGTAIILLIVALFSFHVFLPARRLSIRDIEWGVLITIVGILIGSELFSYYLKTFANYADLYAGLAGIMIVIVYLYVLSVLILFGAEFNAVLENRRKNLNKS